MKPLFEMNFNGTTKFYGTRFVYIAVTDMHIAVELTPRIPVVYSLHIFNLAVAMVLLRKGVKE